jgi:peptidoglycan/LPS O-acetylase OafA/YrhL
MKKNNPSNTTHMAYRLDIDGLRALAVIAVVVYHFFPNRLPGGFIGVDIFFIISGFLISSILFSQLKQNTFSLIDFYSRRIKRIFPALSLVLLVVLIIGLRELLPIELIQLGKHIAAGTGFYSNIVLLNETSYFDKSTDLKPLLHLWSLGIEEQFYIVWPIALLALWKIKCNKVFWIIISVLISFAICSVLTYTNTTKAFYLPFTRFWELGLGGILAWYSIEVANLNILKSKSQDALSIFGFLLIIFSACFFQKDFHFPGAWALIPTSGTMMLITAGSNSLINRYVFSSRPMVWLGLISYPLYLWHWPLIAYWRIIKLQGIERAFVPSKLELLLLSIVLAYGTYYFIELPIRKMALTRKLIILLSIPMIILGFVGLYISHSDGLIRRFPKEIRTLISPIDFHFSEFARFGVCHYDNNVSNTAIVGSRECVENKRPLVFLWGDSYAAALYPGLKALQKSRSFGIVQATECGTPPVSEIDWDNGCVNAKKMNLWNTQALDLMDKIKPELLIMHAWWSEYGDNAWMLRKLQKVIPLIQKNLPQTKIIIIGSVPEWGSWDDGLPRNLYRFWKKNGMDNLPPTMMKYGLSSNVTSEDIVFVNELHKLGVTYISAYNVLCNTTGCLTRVGPKPTDITTIDSGHLSKAGSEYLLAHIEDAIFSKL